MPSFEIKIWKFKYSDQKETKFYEVVVRFTIPDIDKENELTVQQCANEVAYVASGIMGEAANYCGNIKKSCMENIQDAVDLATKKIVETFHICLRQSGMAEEIIHICEVAVFIEESDI